MKRLRFSQKKGLMDVRSQIQVDSMDDALTNRLWNLVSLEFFGRIDPYGNDREQYCSLIWAEFFNKVLDNISQYRDGTFYYDGFVSSTRTWFLTAEWFQKYDFIEFLCSIDQIGYSFSDHVNNALEHEMSGYRIIDGSVAQITSKEEISAIEDAIDDSDRWRPVSNHLRTALIHLSSRENPDYRNSIKESISAVEALCCIITENKEATLGQALKEIEKSHRLHAALKKSFSHLCGYASNADGIRHALLEDSIELRFEDAKFMLVSCSTFVNYLKSKITMK